MRKITLSDSESENIRLLLTAELDSVNLYIEQIRRLLFRIKNEVEPEKHTQVKIIAKPPTKKKRGRRRAKNKGAVTPVTVVGSISQRESILRLEDDFLLKTSASQSGSNGRNKKKRRRRSNYRKSGIILESMGKRMMKEPVGTNKAQMARTDTTETMKENKPISQ
jgi:hypothetical protein